MSNKSNINPEDSNDIIKFYQEYIATVGPGSIAGLPDSVLKLLVYTNWKAY